MPLLARSDNRNRHAGLVQNPGERDLGIIQTTLLCDLGQSLNNRKIFRAVILTAGVLIGFRTHRFSVVFLTAITDDESARQRTERSDGDALGTAEWKHLAFFFAVDDVVIILHRTES